MSVANVQESTPPSLPDLEDALHDDVEDQPTVAVRDAAHDVLSCEVPLSSSPSLDALLPPSLAASLHVASDFSDTSLENQVCHIAQLSFPPCSSSILADHEHIGVYNHTYLLR